MSSDESWDMKLNNCTLKGLVRMQALETPAGPQGLKIGILLKLRILFFNLMLSK